MGGWIQKFIVVLAYTGRAWSWHRTQLSSSTLYLSRGLCRHCPSSTYSSSSSLV